MTNDDICLARQSNMFRILPIAERIGPLLLALPRLSSPRRCRLFNALSCSRGLCGGPLRSGLGSIKGAMTRPLRVRVRLFCFDAGVKYDAPKGDGNGKATWTVGEDYRPGDEIIKAFRELVSGGGGNMVWEAVEFVGEREQDPAIFI